MTNQIDVGQGFIRLVDTMGDDAAIVQAARISYGDGTKSTSDDRALIRYLMRHRHTTPFEMAVAKFHVRAPMDTWRQWIRHRTASVNEVSTRYSEAINDAQRTAPEDWRRQATKNKQGSDGPIPLGVGEGLTAGERALQEHARRVYEARLAAGVAREQARKDLPLSTYTEAYWKMDLHNLLHFLGLRLHPHAQQEIREYADAIARLVREWVPLTWEAFVDYRLAARTFSQQEMQIIRAHLDGHREHALTLLNELPTREQREFAEKIKQEGKL